MSLPYLPLPGRPWERRTPEQSGFDAAALSQAIDYSVAHETSWPTDLNIALAQSNAAEGPNGEVIGPVKARGGVSGLVVRRGYIVAEWGDPDRVDMTFSISKSYLATLAGLALDRGLIRGIDDPVREYADDGGFDPPRNSKIRWRHLLQLTSEWSGTLWGKPDSVDHNRAVGGDANTEAKGTPRLMRDPGSYWEYNDVRVNRLALALLRVWRRPLPAVLRDEIMDPIGASDTWQWHGYRNSYVEIDGQPVQSVSGGGHWGGGIWINTFDHARFGLLHLNRGRWGDRQIVSEAWVETATTPCSVNAGYGCLWWLNTDRVRYPSAPASSFFAIGWGSNLIWVDPEHDLVAVVRWIDGPAFDGFVKRVLAALHT
ncbi:MAG: serine hydrolase [Chloroflexi bacterium]|nr:serine hydrolase [Chloroflexota bacterium]